MLMIEADTVFTRWLVRLIARSSSYQAFSIGRTLALLVVVFQNLSLYTRSPNSLGSNRELHKQLPNLSSCAELFNLTQKNAMLFGIDAFRPCEIRRMRLT